MVVFTCPEGIHSEPIDPRTVMWRTGSDSGRTIYAIDPERGPDQDFVDVLIGMMDSDELGEAVVAAHNQVLALGTGGLSA